MFKVLSLGAEVQSTTVLGMAIKGEIERPDYVVFADTGWEPPSVYDHLETLEIKMRQAGIEYDVVELGNIRNDNVRASGINGDGSNPPALPFYSLNGGSKGMVQRQCTNNYKIMPIDKAVKKRFNIGVKSKNNFLPKIEMWFGISTDESRRCKLSNKWWQTNYYPLIDLGMNRDDCKRWLDKNGFGDVPRSACIGCPFRSNRSWINMRENNPDDWLDAIDFDKAIRTKKGFNGERFLHKDCVPLSEVILSLEELGQMSMWDQECSGMCGL